MLLLSVLVGLFALWMYRERSWYLHDRRSKELKDSLQQTLSILQESCRQHPDSISVCGQDVGTEQCVSFTSLSNDTQQSFCSTHCNESNLSDVITAPTLASNAVFFDKNGLFILAFLFSLMQYEYHCLYAYILPLIQTCVHDHLRDQNVYIHIKRVLGSVYPFTSLLVMASVCFAATLAWWGLLVKDYFIHSALKLCIAYILSCICAFITHNMLHVYPYLPSSLEDWKTSVRELQWWGWLLLRVWGIHDLHSILFTMVYMGAYLYALWICRYFFYYRAQGLVGSAYGNDFFLVNMLGHTALNVWGLLYTLTLITIPPFLPLLLGPSASAGSASSHPLPPASSVFILRVLSGALLRGRPALLCTFIPLSINIVLAALRALYYVFMLRSTYYCYFFLFLGGFFVFNAGVYVYILYMCQYLVCKNDMLGVSEETEDDKKTESGVKGLRFRVLNAARNAFYSSALASSLSAEEKETKWGELERDVAEGIERASELALVYTLYKIVGEGESKSVEQRVLPIFQAVFQTEIFAFQQAFGQEEEERPEDNARSSEDGKDKDAADVDGSADSTAPELEEMD